MIKFHEPENDDLATCFTDSRETPEALLKKLERDIGKHRPFRLKRLCPRVRRRFAIGLGVTAAVLGLFAASRMVDPVRVDSITMDRLWEYKTLAAVISSPAVADIDNDGVNEVIVTSSDGKLYALDGRAGRRIFYFETWHPVLSSPVVTRSAGRSRAIVFAGDDRRVYTLTPDGRCLWASIPQTIDTAVESTPVLTRINADTVPDIVIAGENGKLYGLDGNRGWLIWRSQETSGKFFSTPLAVNANGDLTRDLIVGSPDRAVYAIDGRNGQKIWETRTSGAVNSSAVLLDTDTVAIGDESGVLFLLDAATGKIKAKTDLGSAIVSTPALLNSRVKPVLCVPLENGTVRTVDAATLKTLWTFDSGFQDAFVASPAVYDFNNDRCEDIVLTSRNGNCYLLNGRDGRILCEPFFCGNSISSSPAVADLNRDGFLDIVFGSENGTVYALTVKTAPDRLVSRNRIVQGSFLGRGAATL